MRSPSRARCGGELGAITAEFAAAIPAVLAVVAVCVSALAALATQVGLESAAAQTARAAARGEPLEPYAGDAGTAVDRGEPLVCVTLTKPAMFGAITLEATGCADARGW